MRTKVLIIGGGPAGSLAAASLARAGVDVVVVDRHSFPRDKSCGDALLPDALAALRHASLDSLVLERARRLQEIRIYAPNGRHVDLRGESAVLPRRVLDDLLLREAVRAGAHFMARHALAGPREAGGDVTGAVFRDLETDGSITVEASVVLLATGAAAVPLRQFGVAERESPSATAARCYISVDEETSRSFDHLLISYDRTICPGYGWIFPGPDRVFNVGVGYFYDSPRLPPTTNLRQLLAEFLATFPPAVEIQRHAVHVSELQGAPLRTGLAGSVLARRGLLVIGEAAGLTYSFSGEGIGKAMDSGIRAARLITEELRKERLDLSRLAERYAAEIRGEFGGRFRAYRTVQDWLRRPAFANFLAWRTNSGSYARAQLEGFVTEASSPESLFSVAGLIKALLR